MQNRFIRSRSTAGFTLLEILVVLVILGILAAIAAPSWLSFWANRQTTLAQEELRQGLQQAQAAAIAQRQSWRFSLRQINNQLEWAYHPETVLARNVRHWQRLHPNIVLKEADTTLVRSNGVYYAEFGFNGEVRGRLGTVTVDTRNGIARDKCVIVSTLLGATRKGQEQLSPNSNGRFCY